MATIKQKLAFKKIIENHGNISKSMREVGYSPVTAKNPKNLTNGLGWKELLSYMINDKEIILRINEIAFQEDKRASLQALDMLLKLKDRYPVGKLKVQDYRDELENISE